MKKIFIILALTSISTGLFAFNFTSKVDGDWDNAATWDTYDGGGDYPVAGDNVAINGGVIVTVPEGFDAECANISMQISVGHLIVVGTLTVTNTLQVDYASSSLIIDALGTVTVYGMLMDNGGTVTVNGILNVTDGYINNYSIFNPSSFFIGASGTVTLNGYIDNRRTLTIDGVLSVTGGYINNSTLPASLLIGAGGEVTLLNSDIISIGTITVDGILSVSGGDIEINDGNFNVNGEVTVSE